jgi:hypothetical protein
MFSFTPGPLYPRGNCPRYPLDRRLRGPQGRFGLCGEESNLATAGIPVSRNFFHKLKVIRILFITFYHSTTVNSRCCQWKISCISYTLIFTYFIFNRLYLLHMADARANNIYLYCDAFDHLLGNG